MAGKGGGGGGGGGGAACARRLNLPPPLPRHKIAYLHNNVVILYTLKRKDKLLQLIDYLSSLQEYKEMKIIIIDLGPYLIRNLHAKQINPTTQLKCMHFNVIISV